MNLEFIYMVLLGLLSFSLKSKHMLSMLLNLELLLIILFLGLVNYLMNLNDLSFTMVFLAFSVCEGSLGLAILVDMIRSSGSDLVLLVNFLW
uniref:NADH-ubiquinone oxidoreductase chain 4L n=1 Tax=Sphindus dubius TaxID=295944 RepID=A0A0S2MQQ9_9CUCU|nr:NADH deshydrogenase subunit 4L [Sphindus dubius]